MSPDGAHLYVAAGIGNSVLVFSRDLTTGELSYVETIFDGVGGVEGLAAAWSVALSPDGADVYMTFVDRWRWDIAMYLKSLDVSVFRTADDSLVATGSFRNSLLHSFPDPAEKADAIVDSIFGDPQGQASQNRVARNATRPPSRTTDREASNDATNARSQTQTFDEWLASKEEQGPEQ